MAGREQAPDKIRPMTVKTRILFLEDSPADAELENRALKEAGIVFDSRVVANEKDFRVSLKEFNPDIILLDYKLPDFDGPNALAIAHKVLPDAPAIFVSGSIGQELAVETLRLGALDYVLKNNLEKLSPAVKRAIIMVEIRKEKEKIDSLLKNEFEKFRMAVGEEREARILILEDRATDAELAERVLKEAGIKFTARRVDTENDFKKALDFFSPDLILLDCSLPNYSGLQGLNLAKAELPEVPCIFVSGSVGEDTAAELLRKGAADYVLKQNLERLVPVVRRAIKEGAARRKLVQAQKLLKQSEENFRQITENINEVFFLLDPLKLEMLYMSPAYENIFGDRPETLYVNPSGWLNFVVEEDKPKMQRSFNMALQESVGAGSEESYRIKRRDGEVRFVRARYFSVKDNLGEPYRVAGLVEDITEKVEADRKIDELNKLRSEFVHVISHQLRTPLTTILWSLENMIDQSDGHHGKLDVSALKDARSASLKINDRINDLITAINVLEDKGVVDKKPNSLEKLLNGVVEKLRDKMKSKGLIFEYSAPMEKLPLINCDEVKLIYVFRKLIENAIVYTKDGGRISASLNKHGDKIRFEVTDTGIGVPKADQSKIFTIFFRASNAQIQSPDGSGVSLSIVKRYQESQGGKIGFISEESKGSTFWFEIQAGQA